MMIQIEKLFSYLLLFIPFFLITGPAIPDIIITFGSIITSGPITVSFCKKIVSGAIIVTPENIADFRR